MTGTWDPFGEETVLFAGHVTVNWRTTVTVNVQLAVCPSLDVAVTVTVVVPTGKLLPDAGVPVTATGATPPDVVTLYA